MSEVSLPIDSIETTFVEQMNDLSLDENQITDKTQIIDSSEIESQIRSALNQQTIIQYRQYAAEQHPKELHKQEELIKQLQEQYFQQYITQVFEVQKIYQRQQIEQLKNMYLQQLEESESNTNADIDVLFPALPLVPANLWTRKDIAEFKADILKHQRECCIKIGSLSTATVRVPTHPDGQCVFWEFATDYYDLGFGVYFEWNVQPSENITVHISESSDEEEFEEESPSVENPKPEDVEETQQQDDLEKGRSKKGYNVPTDELIPVYRRDSHLEVYCGSHQYPGRGTYILKFDNSYSVWRSKWLYYRVYYTK